MTCEQIEELLAFHAVGELEAFEAREAREHLVGCAACRETGGGFLETAELLPLALSPKTPSPRLRNRIMAEVYAEASHRTRTPSRIIQLWERAPRSRGLTIASSLSAAAAVLALALGLGGRATTPSALPPSTTTAITLHGTTATPLAHGVVEYNVARHEAVVSVEGLRPQGAQGGLPPVYELWLIRPNTVAVPAGQLSLQADGHTWMSAMRIDSRAEYVGIAATIEPAGGSTVPSGTEVLRGSL